MQWQPIDDLSANWQELASSELPPLVTVWNEQAERLRNSGAFKVFMEKMRREIAIETGIIERLYTIPQGITRLLIEQGINEALIPHGTTDRPIKQIVALIKDQESAIEGLFDFVGRQRSLSPYYVKELHQLLTRNQTHTEALVPATGQIISVPLIRGNWKKQPNNPLREDDSIHEYCPPEQVESEMDNLIAWHHQHQQNQVPPEVEAAWLHHRFTQIHPFQDGNGRVARCLASLVFIQARWFPLVLTRDDRPAYIKALEDADHGQLSSLVNLFAKSQKQSFIRSLGLSEQILSEARQTRTILASITDKYKQRQTASIQERCQKAEQFAETLFETASNRLQLLCEEIKLSVQNLVENAQIFTVVAPAGDERSYYHRYQIVETAKQQDYFANLSSYHSWIQLVIKIEAPTVILLSFHVLGREHLGLLVCSVCAYHRDDIEEGGNISDIQPLTESPFQFSYADNKENLVKRFHQWLEEAIITGLEYWNRSI